MLVGKVDVQDVFYELFFTRLPQQGFTASDIVELYLHRGAYAPTLARDNIFKPL